MAISDAQYSAWLADERNVRCLLVDIEYRSSGGTIIKDYLSTHPYVTDLADTPASTAYRCCVLEVPSFDQRMSDVLVGYTTPSIGNVVVDNGDGALDSWIAANFAGRPLTLYLGDPSWPKSDFRAVLTGVLAAMTVQGTSKLTLEARARDHLLTQDIITTKYTSGASEGRYKPLAYGACYNVSPLYIGTGTDHKYAINAADTYAMTEVRIAGMATTAYTDNGDGTFSLWSEATGQVTCDFEGSYSGGTRFRTIKQIIKDLCVTRGPFVEADFEATTWAALDTTFPQYLGLWIDTPIKYFEALDKLCASVGAFYCIQRDGKILIKKFELSGTATLSLGVDQIVAKGLNIAKIYQPLDNLRLGYKRMWTTQDSFSDNDGAGLISETNRELWRNEYSWVASVNSGATNLLKTNDPKQEGTLLTSKSDCQTEADRWMGIWGSVRVQYAVECFLDGAQVNLGDRVKITHPRLGLAAGVTGTVVKVSDRPTKRRQTIEVLT
jgi:hypothetical protein